MTFAFAGQIFQFVARQNDTFENLVLGPKLFQLKYSRAKVGIGPKYYLGRSIPQAEMCLGPKYALGQSECGAKVVLGPNWV